MRTELYTGHVIAPVRAFCARVPEERRTLGWRRGAIGRKVLPRPRARANDDLHRRDAIGRDAGEEMREVRRMRCLHTPAQRHS